MRAGRSALLALVMAGAIASPTQADEAAEARATVATDTEPQASARPGSALSVSNAPAAGDPALQPLDRGTDPVLFHTGLYLTLVGTATLVGGLLFTTAGPGEYCPYCPSSQYAAVGYAALLGGFAMGATGGVLLVVSTRGDEVAEEAEATVKPSLTIGPGTASAAWRF